MRVLVNCIGLNERESRGFGFSVNCNVGFYKYV